MEVKNASIFYVSPFLVIVLAVILAAMLWEGSIKPNLGNYYFTKYNFSSIVQKKEIYLRKAIGYCPKETIFRTHMLIGYLEVFPQESDYNAEISRQHYDGMTPAWAMLYNCGIVKFKRKQFEDAFKLFDESLFYLPYFDDSRKRLMQIYPLTPFRRRPILMKQMTEVGIYAVRAGQIEVDSLQKQIQNVQTNFISIVQTEKLKMNVPVDWPFDPEKFMFYAPNEIPGGYTVVEIGAVRLPLCVKQQQK